MISCSFKTPEYILEQRLTYNNSGEPTVYTRIKCKLEYISSGRIIYRVESKLKYKTRDSIKAINYIIIHKQWN